jgi:hypothetical protein
MSAPASAGAASVTPDARMQENTVCIDIKPQRKEFKVDSPAQGTHAFDDGTLRGTYTVTGDVVDWTSETVSVDYALVNGVAGTNVYTYGSSTGDTGLVAPDDPAGGPAGLGYFALCYDNQERGRVNILKRTVPAGSPERFGFHPSADLSPADFQLADGEAATFRPKPGAYMVEEAQAPGWRVDRIACDDADSIGSGRTATIVVDPGETVTCTFYNEKEPDVPPPPLPPAPVPPAAVVDVTPPAPVEPLATPPAAVAAAPAFAAAAAPAPASAVKGRTVVSADARLRSQGSCASETVQFTVSGSPMQRVVFSVNGRHVRTVAARGRRVLRVTLPRGRGALSRVTARVTFSNGARPRTLRTTVARCAARQVQPEFTG